MTILIHFRWFWVLLGLAMLIAGIRWSLKSPARQLPVVLGVTGGSVLYLGVVCFIAPWLSTLHGH